MGVCRLFHQSSGLEGVHESVQQSPADLQAGGGSGRGWAAKTHQCLLCHSAACHGCRPTPRRSLVSLFVRVCWCVGVGVGVGVYCVEKFGGCFCVCSRRKLV